MLLGAFFSRKGKITLTGKLPKQAMVLVKGEGVKEEEKDDKQQSRP
jgi:hypothetical protein